MWMVKKFLLDLLESIVLSIILIAIVAGALWVVFSVALFLMDFLPAINLLEHFDK
jgi:hypothetical protein